VKSFDFPPPKHFHHLLLQHIIGCHNPRRRPTTTMATAARRILVEQVKARVFCSKNGGGGNPVTIYSTDLFLSTHAQMRLAQGCEWESVVVHRPSDEQHTDARLPQVSFFMPSVEQVSFCAHAAIGAAYEMFLRRTKNEIGSAAQGDVAFSVANLPDESRPKGEEVSKEYHTHIDPESNVAALEMQTFYKQKEVSRPSLLSQVLHEHCATDDEDLDIVHSVCCHASIARPKTLVPLRTRDLVNEKVVAPTSPQDFAMACKDLDDTTGLYLYAPFEDEEGAWECRQFPRSSGYPEDPATGIAAAALVCHLKSQQKIDLPMYYVYQGTAMGKPSLIVVEDLEMKEPRDLDGSGNILMDASFRLSGRVEIDDRGFVEIEDDVLRI
jgi:predicted PhzF superfamily epimerase YddE/YHI9